MPSLAAPSKQEESEELKKETLLTEELSPLTPSPGEVLSDHAIGSSRHFELTAWEI